MALSVSTDTPQNVVGSTRVPNPGLGAGEGLWLVAIVDTLTPCCQGLWCLFIHCFLSVRGAEEMLLCWDSQGRLAWDGSPFVGTALEPCTPWGWLPLFLLPPKVCTHPSASANLPPNCDGSPFNVCAHCLKNLLRVSQASPSEILIPEASWGPWIHVSSKPAGSAEEFPF